MDIMSSFFFFFQAEDGIRDRNVTGVQTCALPISTQTPPPTPQRAVPAGHRPGVAVPTLPPAPPAPPLPHSAGPRRGAPASSARATPARDATALAPTPPHSP